jgi:GNAT superfamily N-acetyltransferase
MPTSTRFRRASEQDAKALAVFAEKTFRDTYTQFNTPENMQSHCEKSFGERIQLAEIKDPARESWLAEIGGQLVSFAQIILDAPCPSMNDARGIEILRFYVDSSHHGKGLAQDMMRQLVDRATTLGADVLWLGVWNENPRAVAFYKKCDFAHVANKTFKLGTEVQRDFVMCRNLR